MKLRIMLRRRAPWLILAAVLLAGLCLGLWYYHSNYISVSGIVCPRNTRTLDLRGVESPDLNRISQLTGLETLDIRDTGISIADYESLHEALPDCEILWSLPLGDGSWDSDSTCIDAPKLSLQDIPLLSYLPNLTAVNATGCQDYEALLELQRQRPDLELSYNVTAAGKVLSRNTNVLTFDVMPVERLAELLPHFPELTSLVLTGKQPDDDALFALMAEYPQVAISWNLEICGVSVNSLATEVDISGVQVEDLAAFEDSVLRLPNLQKVVMCGCGISNEEMDALNRRHENVQFVWSITIRGVTLRTDIKELMPYKYNLWPSTQEAQDFRYLTELECLDLGHHKISNCDFVAYMPNMKYLLLGDTRISDLTPLENLTQIIYLEIFLTQVTDYTPLLKLTNLQDLNLCYTRGQPEVIAQLTWVDYIRWITIDEMRLYQSEKEMLQAALPDTLLELGEHQSSTGGQWRETQNYYAMRDILGMHYMTG